ncbi:unnamed protein product, partial [Calicophoron daubneyi]
IRCIKRSLFTNSLPRRRPCLNADSSRSDDMIASMAKSGTAFWRSCWLFQLFLILLLVSTTCGLENIIIELKMKYYCSTSLHYLDNELCMSQCGCNPFFEIEMSNQRYEFGGDRKWYRGKFEIYFGDYLSPTLPNKLIFKGSYRDYRRKEPTLHIAIGDEYRRVRNYIVDDRLAITVPRIIPNTRRDAHWVVQQIDTCCTMLQVSYKCYCKPGYYGKRCEHRRTTTASPRIRTTESRRTTREGTISTTHTTESQRQTTTQESTARTNTEMKTETDVILTSQATNAPTSEATTKDTTEIHTDKSAPQTTTNTHTSTNTPCTTTSSTQTHTQSTTQNTETTHTNTQPTTSSAPITSSAITTETPTISTTTPYITTSIPTLTTPLTYSSSQTHTQSTTQNTETTHTDTQPTTSSAPITSNAITTETPTLSTTTSYTTTNIPTNTTPLTYSHTHTQTQTGTHSHA